MTELEKRTTGILISATELRQLIIDNPDLPLVVFAGEDAYGGDYGYTSCSYVSASVGEFLDCQQTVRDTQCYTDRDDFAEDLEDSLCDEYRNWESSEKEWEQYVQNEISKYNPYWKKCIIVYVNN